MLKNSEQNETSSHFSYNDYKKQKPKKAPNKDVMVFASVFIIGVLIILGFVKILSPNVDVAITKESDIISSEDDNISSIIDDRLRKLKLEDEGKQEGDEEMFSPELDEKVVLPTRQRKTVGEIEAEQAKIKEAEEQKQQQHAEATAPQPKETKTAPQPEQIVNARVVVGYYATEKQAEVAKSIIQDAGIGVTPIVKNLGGYYTLQVGSYSTKEKAQQAANGLLKSNFPARVITD